MVIGNGRTSRAEGSGGFAFVLVGRCAEDIGAQIVARHAGRHFDSKGVLRGNLLAHAPVAHDGLPEVQEFGQLGNAAGSFDGTV